MFDPAKIQHIYIAYGYTDLRRGIDGLVSIVQIGFQLDPFANALFLFCGRRSDRFKALYWDSDGFILLYKRLERNRYQWPRSQDEVLSLIPQEFRWLLDQIGEQIGVKEDLRRCFPGTWEQILSIVYYLLLEDSSSMSRFSKWASLHTQPYGEDIPSQ